MKSEALKNIPEPDSVEKPIVDEDIKSQLPEPKGWRVLVAMPKPDEKTEGGIIKASVTVKDEELSNICGYVIELVKNATKTQKDFLLVLGAKKVIGFYFVLTQALV